MILTVQCLVNAAYRLKIGNAYPWNLMPRSNLYLLKVAFMLYVHTLNFFKIDTRRNWSTYRITGTVRLRPSVNWIYVQPAFLPNLSCLSSLFPRAFGTRNIHIAFAFHVLAEEAMQIYQGEKTTPSLWNSNCWVKVATKINTQKARPPHSLPYEIANVDLTLPFQIQ